MSGLPFWNDSALLGYTGFVGQTLLAQRAVAGRFNSKNLADLPSGDFDTLICAAAPAAMWAANADPAADAANLERIFDAMAQTRARTVILISTIAVFDDAAAGYTESDARYETHKAYGRNRRALEERVLERFERPHVVRLPALFGQGLKKNFVFDLLNPAPSFLPQDKFAQLTADMPASSRDLLRTAYRLDENLGSWVLDRQKLDETGERQVVENALAEAGFRARNFTNSDSRFQYYDMRRLAGDIDRMVEGGWPVLNVCSEPLAASEVCLALTGESFANDAPPLVAEDMRSNYAAQFGDHAPYLYGREDTLAALRAFAAEARA